MDYGFIINMCWINVWIKAEKQSRVAIGHRGNTGIISQIHRTLCYIMSYKDGALVFTIEVYIFSNNLCLSLSPLIVLDI